MNDDLHPCCFCLHDQCTVVKFDKRGRPYMRCRICNTTSFMTSDLALRGLFLFAPRLMQLMQNLQGRIPEVDKRAREFVMAHHAEAEATG